MQSWKIKHAGVSLLARRAPSLLPLRHLAAFHGSNKVTITLAGVDYAAVYDRYLGRRRREPMTLLELGVYRGESLRTWRSYLPHATVVGLDIDPQAADRAAGFDVYIGSQADEELLARVVADHPRIDVIVDDASHLTALTVASFRQLFPHLASGGLYFIEDIPDDSWTADEMAAWPGMSLNDPAMLANRREDLDALLTELARDTLAGPERLVDFLHVWPRIITIGRA